MGNFPLYATGSITKVRVTLPSPIARCLSRIAFPSSIFLSYLPPQHEQGPGDSTSNCSEPPRDPSPVHQLQCCNWSIACLFGKSADPGCCVHSGRCSACSKQGRSSPPRPPHTSCQLPTWPTCPELPSSSLSRSPPSHPLRPNQALTFHPFLPPSPHYTSPHLTCSTNQTTLPNLIAN